MQIALVAAVSVAGAGSLPGGSFAEVLRVREGSELFVQLACELLAVYVSLGYEPQDFFAPYSRFARLRSASFDTCVDETIALGESMWEQGYIGRPSLHEDLLAGRPTEVEHSLGRFLAAADEAGIEVPALRAAYRIVKVLEQLAAARVRQPALAGAAK